MNKSYVISDTHFGHKKLVEIRGYTTIEEHDRDLIEKWNSIVTDNDTVWHLGDVYFGGAKNHAMLGELRGIKRLVLGNHDAYPLEIYQQYFRRIYGAAPYKDCLLTHVPVHTQQMGRRFRLNVHGHMHSHILNDPRYVCVSVEQTDGYPVLLKDIIK